MATHTTGTPVTIAVTLANSVLDDVSKIGTNHTNLSVPDALVLLTVKTEVAKTLALMDLAQAIRESNRG